MLEGQSKNTFIKLIYIIPDTIGIWDIKIDLLSKNKTVRFGIRVVSFTNKETALILTSVKWVVGWLKTYITSNMLHSRCSFISLSKSGDTKFNTKQIMPMFSRTRECNGNIGERDFCLTRYGRVEIGFYTERSKVWQQILWVRISQIEYLGPEQLKWLPVK